MVKLSPSSLNRFLDCPRCFWLQINKELKRPGMPVATITSGLDRVVKEYLDEFRSKNILPSFLEGKIPGKLMKDFPKKGWLEYIDPLPGAKLGGYLDECIKLDDGNYAVLDHKTRGRAPDSVHPAYQFQMDAYTLLLEKNKYPTRRSAYLAYYIPKKIISGSDFNFEVLIKEISTDPERARTVFYKALEVLKGGLPSLQKDCSFCKWTETSQIK
ncbi:PD-(D/E)XK nuclease family protein [Candidatus Omnitrophota bacterium]